MLRRRLSSALLGGSLWLLAGVTAQAQTAIPPEAGVGTFPAPADEPGLAPAAFAADAWPSLIRAQADALRVRNAPPLDLSGLANKNLKKGDRGPAVNLLVAALQTRGWLIVEPAPGETSENSTGTSSGTAATLSFVMDDSVLAAIKAAQVGYGLLDDGKPGSQLYLALSTGDADKAQALEAWADQVEGLLNTARGAGQSRLIIVNLPSFTLHALDVPSGKEVLESRVVVGAPFHKTPRFDTRIVNLKYNPDWSPPASIAGARYTPPGPHNPLGMVRFSTDNRVNIYLHDTNQRHLFDSPMRALSHGCIRVQSWKDLAAWVGNVSADDVQTQVDKTKTHYVSIAPVTVHLVYSRVDLTGGQTSVWPDVYGLGVPLVPIRPVTGGEVPAAAPPAVAVDGADGP